MSVSVTVRPDRRLDAAVRDLQRFAGVAVESGKTVLAVVGRGLHETPGIGARAFGALAHAGLNVEMLSQAASRTNLSMVVADASAADAVRALHAAFFEEPAAPPPV